MCFTQFALLASGALTIIETIIDPLNPSGTCSPHQSPLFPSAGHERKVRKKEKGSQVKSTVNWEASSG